MSNSIYNDFAAKFAASSITSLVDSFNREIGNMGWTSARAAHDKALIDELKRRGIDLSAVCNEGSTSFAHKVKCVDNRLVLI